MLNFLCKVQEGTFRSVLGFHYILDLEKLAREQLITLTFVFIDPFDKKLSSQLNDMKKILMSNSFLIEFFRL